MKDWNKAKSKSNSENDLQCKSLLHNKTDRSIQEVFVAD